MTEASEILDQARINIAAKYPPVVGECPASGVPIRGIAYQAIMGGHWDGGKLIQDEIARLRLRALPENAEEG